MIKHMRLLVLLLPVVSTFAQETKHLALTNAIKDSLRKEIAAMCVSDQKYRWQIMLGETDSVKLAGLKNMDENAKWQRVRDVTDNKIGISKSQKDSLWILQNFIDSINFMKLSGVIKNYGFPKKYCETYKITAILQHNSYRSDEGFLGLLKGEVKNGNMPGMEYAALYDRIQNYHKQPELYYVNKRYDYERKTPATGTPIDLEATNKARKEIGLKRWKE